MINDRYVKKSLNISFFYSWSDANIEGALGKQPSVSLTRPGLFMKPTKTLPAETKAIWLSGDQYATVHHPGEFSGHMKC